MIEAIEPYLALRRAAGFSISNTEYLLRSFARFAPATEMLRDGVPLDQIGLVLRVPQQAGSTHWSFDTRRLKGTLDHAEIPAPEMNGLNGAIPRRKIRSVG
jgi:hypothetical protein